MVSGVVVSWASMVKVRSYTDDALHTGREFENAAIRATGGRQHQTDRHLPLAMTRERNGAAVDHVDQRAITQRPRVRLVEGLVVSEIRNPRRRVGGCRQDQRVI